MLSHNTVPTPIKRLLILAVAVAVMLAVFHLTPAYSSFTGTLREQDAIPLEQLRSAYHELESLKAVKTMSPTFHTDSEEGWSSDGNKDEGEDKTALKNLLASSQERIVQLEQELRNAREKESLVSEAVDYPAFMGSKVNERFWKTSFQQEAPEYQKVVYTATGRQSDANELIVLISIAHSESYGKGRTFGDMLETIKHVEFSQQLSTLGLLVGSKEEFHNIEKIIDAMDEDKFFSKVVLIQAQFIEDLYTVDRDIRHSLAVQKQRRRAISRARNFLITHALENELYSLCIDSDMIKLPQDMLQLFVKTNKDIIVPRIRQGGAQNYDFNSWRGQRKVPTPEEEEKLDTDPEFLFIPGPDGAAHMHDFINEPRKWKNNNKRSFALELDSVGGAVLFVKSEIFKQGILFPPFYVVGTKWNRLEGYDGIETEGLCYQAKTIGYSCWGMPNLVCYHDVELQDG